jgi:hypothetical protein
MPIGCCVHSRNGPPDVKGQHVQPKERVQHGEVDDVGERYADFFLESARGQLVAGQHDEGDRQSRDGVQDADALQVQQTRDLEVHHGGQDQKDDGNELHYGVDQVNGVVFVVLFIAEADHEDVGVVRARDTVPANER